MSTIVSYTIVGIVMVIMALATWVIVSKVDKEVNNDKEVK